MLDDLQWVDRRSFSILEYLVEMSADYGVLIVGSYRVNEIHRHHPLSKLIDAVGKMKNAQVLTIKPLTQEQTGSLVKAIIKGKTAQFDRLSGFIFEKSRGNPLYILDVVQNLFQEKVIRRGDKSLTFDEAGLARIQIPKNLQNIILQRINHLDATDIAILSDASALGIRFATDLLIELEKTKGVSRQSVVSCLDKAHAHWILEKDTGVAEGRFSFAHDRIRDVFYKIIEKQKKTIHNRIGLLMESTCHQSGEKADALFDLAHHFINGENEAKILEYVYPAGLYAMDRYDYDLAVRYLTLIKGILKRHLSLKEDSAKRALWYQCGKKLGEAMLMTGATENGVALLTSLVSYCDDPMEKAGLYYQTCSAYTIRKEWRLCEQHGKAGLALLGESLPVKEKEVKYCIAKNLVLYILQRLLPPFIMVHKFGEIIGIGNTLFKQSQLAFEKGNLERAEKKALECLDIGKSHNVQNIESWINALLGAIYLEKNQAARAIGHLRQGMDIYRGKAVFGEYSVWNFPLYAEALIRNRSVNNDISSKHIKKACKMALAKTRSWINYHGISLRVYAIYLGLVKRPRRAENMFLESIRVLETLCRRFELALSRRAYGYFLRENGRYEAAFSQFNQAWAIFDDLGSAFRDRIVDYPGPGDPTGETAQRVAHIRKKDVAFNPAKELAAFGDMQALTRYVLETSMQIAGAQGGVSFCWTARADSCGLRPEAMWQVVIASITLKVLSIRYMQAAGLSSARMPAAISAWTRTRAFFSSS